jgi:hypothetical protein
VSAASCCSLNTADVMPCLHTPTSPCHCCLPHQAPNLAPDDFAYLAAQIAWLDEVASPMHSAQPEGLLQNSRLSMRSCSQLVSGLKALSQPLPVARGSPHDNEDTCISGIMRAQLACHASVLGPSVHASWLATGTVLLGSHFAVFGRPSEHSTNM